MTGRARLARLFPAVALIVGLAAAPGLAQGSVSVDTDPNAGYRHLAQAIGDVIARDGRADPAILAAATVAAQTDGEPYVSFTDVEPSYDPGFDIALDQGFAAVVNPHPVWVSLDRDGNGMSDFGEPEIFAVNGTVDAIDADVDLAADLLRQAGWMESVDGLWSVERRDDLLWADGTPVQDYDALYQHALMVPEATVTDAGISIPGDILLPAVADDVASGRMMPPVPGATQGGSFEVLLGILDEAEHIFGWPPNPGPPAPIVLLGGSTDGPLPVPPFGDPPNVLLESVVATNPPFPPGLVGDTPVGGFQSLPQFNGDFALDMTNLNRVGFGPGGFETPEDRSYDGQFFGSSPSNAGFVSGPNGTVHIISADDLGGATLWDFVVFVTDAGAPFTPETVLQSGLRGHPAFNPALSTMEITPLVLTKRGPGAAPPIATFPLDELFVSDDCPEYTEEFTGAGVLQAYARGPDLYWRHVDGGEQVTASAEYRPIDQPARLEGINFGNFEQYTIDVLADGDVITGQYVFDSDPVIEDGQLVSDPCFFEWSAPKPDGWAAFLETMGVEDEEPPAAVTPDEPEQSDDPAVAAPADEPTPVDDPAPADDPTDDDPVDATGSGDSGGGFPWWIPVLIVAGLGAAGLYYLRRDSGGPCDELVKAWLRAKHACDEANRQAEKANGDADTARGELDAAEQELEDLCNEFPPACWEGDPSDTWAEDPDRPGSRRDRFDIFVERQWAQAQWQRYRNDEISAEDLQERWNEAAPSDFAKELREEFDDKRADHERLQKGVADAAKKARDAEQVAAGAAGAAREACTAAEAARQRAAECLDREAASPPSPVDQPATDGGGEGGPVVPPGAPATTAGPRDEEPAPCEEGTEEERSVRSISVNVPVDFEPVILGGAAHAAALEGAEIAAGLKQAEIGANALGRIFGLAPGAKLVHEFSVSGAAGVGTTIAGEAAGVPIPTNLLELGANYAEVVLRAAGAIIGKVTELQERRLPDVELRIESKNAPFRLTCAEIWVCRNGTWVFERKRLTVERTGPDRAGGRRNLGGGFTWAQAQEEIARFGRRFGARLRRTLQQMKDFETGCS